ncbi:MAG: hypothetical protein WBV85_05850 [Solirubrobacteraceae bacterium]
MSDLPGDIEIELAALADGSLTGERREEALGRMRESRDLQGALAEQQRVVELTAAANAKVDAPESLHRRVEALFAPGVQGAHGADQGRASGRSVSRRGNARTLLGSRLPGLTGLRVGLAGAGALAVIAVLAVVGLSAGKGHAGSSSGLGVQQTAALTLSAATGPAPSENERNRSQLQVAVDGVPFPYWKERFGWRGIGTRNDVIAGRAVTTVFYANSAGQRVGYAIASGAAPTTMGGTVVRRWGVSYRVLEHEGATVVTWQRAGHLCVMAGRGVSARTLVNLASWGSEKSHAA